MVVSMNIQENRSGDGKAVYYTKEYTAKRQAAAIERVTHLDAKISKLKEIITKSSKTNPFRFVISSIKTSFSERFSQLYYNIFKKICRVDQTILYLLKEEKSIKEEIAEFEAINGKLLTLLANIESEKTPNLPGAKDKEKKFIEELKYEIKLNSNYLNHLHNKKNHNSEELQHYSYYPHHELLKKLRIEFQKNNEADLTTNPSDNQTAPSQSISSNEPSAQAAKVKPIDLLGGPIIHANLHAGELQALNRAKGVVNRLENSADEKVLEGVKNDYQKLLSDPPVSDVPSIKQLAFMHASSYIEKSSLEGGNPKENISYWKQMVSLWKEGKSSVDPGLTKSEIEKIEEAFDDCSRIMDGAAMVDYIQQKLTEDGKECTVPSGWNGLPGHFMLCKFTRFGDQVAIEFLNRGGGSEHHSIEKVGHKKIKRSYKSDPVIVPIDKLIKSNVGLSFLKRLEGVRNYDIKKNNSLNDIDSSDLYCMLQIIKDTIGVKPEDVCKEMAEGHKKGLGVSSQRSGSCSDTGFRMPVFEAILSSGQSEHAAERIKRAMFSIKFQSLLDSYKHLKRAFSEKEPIDPNLCPILRIAAEEHLTRLLKLQGKAHHKEWLRDEEFMKEYAVVREILKEVSDIEASLSQKSLLPAERVAKNDSEHGSISPLKMPPVFDPKKDYQVRENTKNYLSIATPDPAFFVETLDLWLLEIKAMKNQGKSKVEIIDSIYHMFSKLPMTSGDEKDDYWDKIPEKQLPMVLEQINSLVITARSCSEQQKGLQETGFIIGARGYDIGCQIAPRISSLKMKGFGFEWAYSGIYNCAPILDANKQAQLMHIRENFSKRNTPPQKTIEKEGGLFPTNMGGDEKEWDAFMANTSHGQYANQFYTVKAKMECFRKTFFQPRQKYFVFMNDADHLFFPQSYHTLSSLSQMSYPIQGAPKENESSLFGDEDFYLGHRNSISVETGSAEPNPKLKKGSRLDRSDSSRFTDNENEIFLEPLKEGALSIPSPVLEEFRCAISNYGLMVPSLLDAAKKNAHVLSNLEVQGVIEQRLGKFNALKNAFSVSFEPMVKKINEFLMSGIERYGDDPDGLETLLWIVEIGVYLEGHIYQNRKDLGTPIEFPDFYSILSEKLALEKDSVKKVKIVQRMMMTFANTPVEKMTEEQKINLLSCKIYLEQHKAINESEDPKLLSFINQVFSERIVSIEQMVKNADENLTTNIGNTILNRLVPDESALAWKRDGLELTAGSYTLHIPSLSLFKDERGIKDLNKEISRHPSYLAVVGDSSFSSVLKEGFFYRLPDETIRIAVHSSQANQIVIQKKMNVNGVEGWYEYKPQSEIEGYPLPAKLKGEGYHHWQSCTTPSILITDRKSQAFCYSYDSKQGISVLDERGAPTREFIADLYSEHFNHPWKEFINGYEKLSDVLINEVVIDNDGNRSVSKIEFPRLHLSFTAKKAQDGSVFLFSDQYPEFYLIKDQTIPALNHMPGVFLLRNKETGREMAILQAKDVKRPAFLDSKTVYTHDPILKKDSRPFFTYMVGVDTDEFKPESPEASLYLSLLFRNQREYSKAFKYLKASEKMERDSSSDIAMIKALALGHYDASAACAAYDLHLYKRCKLQREKFVAASFDPKKKEDASIEFEEVKLAQNYFQGGDDYEQDVSEVPFDLRLSKKDEDRLSKHIHAQSVLVEKDKSLLVFNPIKMPNPDDIQSIITSDNLEDILSLIKKGHLAELAVVNLKALIEEKRELFTKDPELGKLLSGDNYPRVINRFFTQLGEGLLLPKPVEGKEGQARLKRDIELLKLDILRGIVGKDNFKEFRKEIASNYHPLIKALSKIKIDEAPSSDLPDAIRMDGPSAYLKKNFADLVKKACGSANERALLKLDLYFLSRSKESDTDDIGQFVSIINQVADHHEKFKQMNFNQKPESLLKDVITICQGIEPKKIDIPGAEIHQLVKREKKNVDDLVMQPVHSISLKGRLEDLKVIAKHPLNEIGDKYFTKSESLRQKGEFPDIKGHSELDNRQIDELKKGHKINQETKVEVFAAKEPFDTEALSKEIQSEMELKDKRILELTAEIELLANKLPQDKNEAVRRRAKIQAGQVKKLTLGDPLIAAFLMQNNELIKSLNPALQDDDIITIQKKMVELFISGRDLKLLESTLPLLAQIKPETKDSEKENLIQQIGEKLSNQTHYEIDDQPQFLVYEYITGMILRKEQVDLLNWGLDHIDKLETLLFQFDAGGGKTKVLMPIFAFMLANKVSSGGEKCLPILMNLGELYEIGKRDLDASLYSTFKQQQELLEISLETPLTAAQVNIINNRLNKYMKAGKCLNIKSETAHALLINRQMALDAKNFELYEALDNLISFFNKHGVVLIDEAHRTVGDALQETNYALGNSKTLPVDEQRLVVDLAMMLMGQFKKIEIDTPQGKKPIEEVVKLKENHQALLSDEALKSVVNSLQDVMAVYLLDTYDQGKEAALEDVANFLKAEGDKKPDWLINLYNNEKTKELANTICLAKRCLKEILPHTLRLIQGIDYGDSIHPDDLTCAPRHKKQPVAARFQDVFITAYLTAQNVLQQGLKDDYVKICIESLMKRHIEQKKFLRKGQITLAQNLLNEWWKAGEGAKGAPAPSLDSINRQDMDAIIKRIASSPSVCKHFLLEHALPQIKLFPEKITSTPPDLLAMFNRSISFTATPGMIELYPHQLQKEDAVNLKPSFEADVVASLCQEKNRAIQIASNPDNLEEFFSSIYTSNESQFKEFCCIIDNGGLFRKHQNKEVVEAFLKFCQTKGISFSASLYKSEEKANFGKLLLKEEDKEHALSGSNLKESLRKIGKNFEMMTLFTLFDLTSTTGTDILQKNNAKGILTVGEGQTKTQTIQAAMRLRKLLSQDGQTISWVIEQELNAQIPKEVKEKLTPEELFSWMIQNESKLMEKAVVMRAYQGISHLIRKNAWRKINELSSVEERHKLYLQYRKGLVDQVSYDPFSLISEKKLIDTKAALEEYAKSCFAKLEDVSKTTLEDFLGGDLESLNLIIEQTRALLPQIQASTSSLSQEMHQHQEAKQEQKQEQEVKQKVEQLAIAAEHNTFLSENYEAANHTITDPEFFSCPLKNEMQGRLAKELKVNDVKAFNFIPDDLYIADQYFKIKSKQDFLLKPIRYVLVVKDNEGYKYVPCSRKGAEHYRNQLTKESNGWGRQAVLLGIDGSVYQNGQGAFGFSPNELKELEDSKVLRDRLVLLSFLNGQFPDLGEFAHWIKEQKITEQEFEEAWKYISHYNLGERKPDQELKELIVKACFGKTASSLITGVETKEAQKTRKPVPLKSL